MENHEAIKSHNFQKLIDELKTRGIINNVTNHQKISMLKSGDGVYIGFDPSAISLHLGNYIQMTILKRFENFGFKPFAILGGATGMIGDPSGKSNERNLLSETEITKNKQSILKQLESFNFQVVDNLDFYKNMSTIEFLRDVGKHLNINYMISKDIVKKRLESGISFTEFSYQLIQGWDFKLLYDRFNVKVQVGGSDQWGNITAGIELIRKTVGDNNSALGLTTNLLTTSSGKKFGKSENNALWLDKSLTSAYQLYQYLFNSDDENVEKFLKWLTFLPVTEIAQIIEKHQVNPQQRYAQKKLAYEVVKDIHGVEDVNTAVKISDVLFGNEIIANISDGAFSELVNHLPVYPFKKSPLIDFLVNNKITPSKSEARDLIKQKAIEVNGHAITSFDFTLEDKPFRSQYSIIKKGKKNYFLISHQ